jgi:methylated-DNA-protein-cysteine methyltransferase-like protein
MPGSQNKFDLAIWKVVSAITRGSVMAYGEVARAAGYPRHARMVSKAMSRSPDALPWFRVVRSDRTLAFEPGSDAYSRQRGLLEKEGVRFIDGKVVAATVDEAKDLDELIWGPEE